MVTTSRRPGRTGPAPRRASDAKRARPSGARAAGGARRSPATRTAARTGRAAPPDRVESAWNILAGHAEDVWGIALATAAVLALLALYADALGPAGHQVRHVAGVVFGVGRFLLPPLLAAAGVRLVVGSAGRRPARATLGAVLAVVAVAGLADLAGGAPPLGADAHRLSSAGGWAGALVGDPLRTALAGWGAAVVLVAVLAVALVILTGITVRSAASAVASAARAVGRAAVAARDRRQPRSDSQTAAVRAAGEHADRDLTGERWAAGVDVPDLLAGPGSAGARSMAGGGDAGTAADPEGSLSGAGVVTPASVGATSSGPTGENVAGVPVAAEGTGTGTSTGTGTAAGAARRRPPRAPTADEVGDVADQMALDLALPAGDWRLPPARLLRRSERQVLDEAEIQASGRALVDALRAHGVDTGLVGYTVGPTVTRFELELGPGVKVARVTSLAKDIAYAMASPDVRILAPIPGKSAIGVEVPNRRRDLVTLGDVLFSAEARAATHPLAVALGRDIAGRPVMATMADMPHILISGATGAGKSSCINSIITSILMRSTPEQVRLILIDPKRVELGQYNGLPHLLTEVVTDPKKAANALSWAVREMERRYDLLAEVGMRDITGYNDAVDRGELGGAAAGADDGGSWDEAGSETGELPSDGPGGGGRGQGGPIDGSGSAGQAGGGGDTAADADAATVDAAGHAAQRVAASRRAVLPVPNHQRLPFVLVVVDELNDLMMVAARDVEESVCRIAQMARAVGIHLVLATQRPSVDVITGVIKANVPSRLAFSVSSLADSRVILDQPGAERLVGKGDMLLLTASSSVPRRIQGPWVSEEEVRSVAGHWRRQRTPQYVDGIAGEDSTAGGFGGVADDDDELLGAAMDLVVRSQLGSTSMLQRKLRVGFARAGRLMDLLERRGVVGPSEGSKARSVLMTPDELDELAER